MIPSYSAELERIHTLVWYEQQRALERYASDLWIAVQVRDRIIRELGRQNLPIDSDGNNL